MISTATKTGLDTVKSATKKVFHKTVEATVEVMIDVNSRNVKEIVVPPEKKQEILNELRQVL